MRFVIFSGTTEGRELSLHLAGLGAQVTVCVATDYGGEEQGEHPGIQIRTGPLTAEEKQELLTGAGLCVDATHPYATHVTESVRRACEAAGVPYIRLLRQQSETAGAAVMPDAKAAAEYLAARQGNILLTTGSKELAAYGGIAPERIYPRVLPSHQSISACEALGIPHRNIIAMQGPFTREMNEAMLRQYQIRFLVTKDGGAPGGFPEKAMAAKATGVQLIVLRRPEETGANYEEAKVFCEKLVLIDRAGNTVL